MFKTYERKVQSLVEDFSKELETKGSLDFVHLTNIKSIAMVQDYSYRNELAIEQELFEGNVHDFNANAIIDLDDMLISANVDAEKILTSLKDTKKNSILSDVRFKYLYEKLKTNLENTNKKIDEQNERISKQKKILERLKRKSFYWSKKQMVSSGKLNLERDKVAAELTLLRRKASDKKKRMKEYIKHLTIVAESACQVS